MEFRFNVNDVFKQPIVEVGHTLIPSGFKGDRRALWDALSKVTDVVNAMGSASATAQSLSKPITSADRLRNCDQQTLYLLIDQKACNGKGAVTGMLKTGKKGLYVFDRDGHYYQVQSPCILDFYVHESRQRSGLGKHLFEHMLQKEAIKPEQLAIDRPSEKFLGFLTKHYRLSNPIRQMNNYVVYDGFFPQVKKEDQAPVGSGDTSKNGANGLQAQIVTSPYGRYGAPRPPCSMGQIIHNQSSAVTPQEPTGNLQDQVHPHHHVPQIQWTMQPNKQQEVCGQNESVQYANNTVSAPDFTALPYHKAGNGLERSEACNIRSNEVLENSQNNSKQEFHWPFNSAQAYTEVPRSRCVTYPTLSVGDLLQPENFKETPVVPQKSTYDLSGRPIDPNSVSRGNGQFFVQVPGSEKHNYFAKSLKSATTTDQQQINTKDKIEQNQSQYVQQVYVDPNTNQQQLVYLQVPSQHYIPQHNVQYVPMQQNNQQQLSQHVFATEPTPPNVVYHQPYIPQESNQNMQMNNVEQDPLQYQQQPRSNEQITYQQYYPPQQIKVVSESKSQPIIQPKISPEHKAAPQIVLNQKTGQYHYMIPSEQNEMQYQITPADGQNIERGGVHQSYINQQQHTNQTPEFIIPVQQQQMQSVQNTPTKQEQIRSMPQQQYIVNQQYQPQNQMVQNIPPQQIQSENTDLQTMSVQCVPEQTIPNQQLYSNQQTSVQPQVQHSPGQTIPNQYMYSNQQTSQVQQNQGQAQQPCSMQNTTQECLPEQTTLAQQAYSTQQTSFQPQRVYSVQQIVPSQPQEGQGQHQQVHSIQMNPQTMTVPTTLEHSTSVQQTYPIQMKNPQTMSVPIAPEQSTPIQQAYSTQHMLVQPQMAYSMQQNVPHQQGQPQQINHITVQQPSPNQYATPSIAQTTNSTKDQNIRVPIQQNYSVPQSYQQMQVPTNYLPQQMSQNQEQPNVLWTQQVNPTYQQPQYVQNSECKQMPTMDAAGDKRELESETFLRKIYMEPLFPIENVSKNSLSSTKIQCPNLLRSLCKRSESIGRQSSKQYESQKRQQKPGSTHRNVQSSKSLPQNGTQPLFVTKNKILCKGCISRS